MTEEPETAEPLSWEGLIFLTRAMRHAEFAEEAGITLDWAAELSLDEIDQRLDSMGAYEGSPLSNDENPSDVPRKLQDYVSASIDCYHAAELFDPDNFGGLDKLLALKSAWNFGQHALYVLVERLRRLGDTLKLDAPDSSDLTASMAAFMRETKPVIRKRGMHTHEQEVQPAQLRRLERLWMTVAVLPQVTQDEFDTLVRECATSLRAEYVQDFRRIHAAAEAAISSGIKNAMEQALGVPLPDLADPLFGRSNREL